MTVTWYGWVENIDIGEGPIALYLLWQQVFNSTSGWQSVKNLTHYSNMTTYSVTLSNLDPNAQYRFRVDVVGADGDKYRERVTNGFTSDYFQAVCIIPTTTVPLTTVPTTTTFKPPAGSLFTTYKLSNVNESIRIDWTIDNNYNNVVGGLTLSYAIVSYGDCKVVSNPVFRDLSIGVNENNYTLINLSPWTRYTVRMIITTSQQNISDNQKRVEAERTTPETAPVGNVQEVSKIAETATSLTITWKMPDCEQRGGYFVRFDVIVNSSLNISSDSPFKEIMGLMTFTDYVVQIAYINTIGAGPLSAPKTFKTGEGIPEAPLMISLTPDTRSVVVTFNPPKAANGIIVTYEILYSSTADFSDSLQKPSVSTNENITGLSPAKIYYVKVRARTGAGYGIYSNVLFTTTKEDFPGPPSSVILNFRNETCLGVTWEPPVLPNGVILLYFIVCQDIAVTNPRRNASVDGTSRSHILCNLNPGQRYQIDVYAITSKGLGEPVHLFEFTEQSTPPPPPPPKKINATATTITIAIDPVVLTTGPLSLYLVYVNDITGVTGRRKRATGNPPGYITAKFLPLEVLTTTYLEVGDDKTYNGMHNKPLIGGHKYDIYLEIRSELLGLSKTSYSKIVDISTPVVPTPASIVATASTDYTGVIVAIIVIVILILIAVIIICIIFWYRRSRSYTPYITQFDDKGSKDIYSHVDDYDPHKYWNTIYSHRESRYIIAGRELLPPEGSHFDMNGVVESKNTPAITFQQEFHDLPHGRLASWNVALKPQNQRKNRFPHLLPYDHSRIILRPDDNSSNDYINANFIHGYQKPNAYIAAQSPFDEETVLDFWRMIYQMNVSVIVMITNIVEDNIVKCTKYWPDSDQGKVTYGNFFLELIDTKEFADYVIRTLKVKPSNGSTKIVHIFDFCSWPDHGVLDDQIPLLEMRIKVNEYHSDSPTSPLLVHCGTGVGRTGTYIAIDYLLKQYDREGRISVSACVRRMRKDRIQMVRTVKQYIFIYDAIFESKHAGKTRAGLDLKEKYHQLTRKNPNTKHSYLRDQFDCLCKFTRKLHSAHCTDALSHANMDKNRFPDVVPSNKHRAILRTPGGVGRTDYVNAVLLDSHRKSNHFIVTQTPLHTTVIDFWKLVYDHNVHTIVMMENYKHEDDTCAEYWPEEKKMKQYEPFFIDSVAVYQQDNITIRHFKIHSMLNPKVQAREVRQFQFNAWNDTDFVPKSKSMILDLMDLVNDWQNVSCDHECPVVVHCKDGATHSGLYVAVSNICDAMLDDGDVDVYHTVKHAKKRRTQILDLVEQYRFCYKVLWDFMNMRLPGGTLTNMMDHTQADKLYNVGSLSLPSYTSHLEYSQFDYAA